MKVLILGGTGIISSSIVEELLKKNHEVTIFNRGTKSNKITKGVEQITGDRSQRENFENTLKKLKFDVVIDMICFNLEDARSTIKTFSSQVKQIVICSSIAAYQRPYNSLPIKEENEKLSQNKDFIYGFNKAEIERYLQSVSKNDKINITIIRPSLTFGIGSANIGVLRQNVGIIDRIKRGKPLISFGDGTIPWPITFVSDMGKAFVGVVGNEKTYGQSYHVANDCLNVWDDLYLEFGKLVGKTPDIRHLPAEFLFKAAPNLCAHLYYEKCYAGFFDISKIKRDVPDFQPKITLKDGVKMIYDWYIRDNHQIDKEKDAFEDKLIGFYDDWIKQITNIYIK